MNRESFIFYKSFYEAISKTDIKTQVSLYDAICRKALYDEETTLDGLAEIIYTLIKPQLDANTKRFTDGQKGGRPPTKTTGFEGEKTTGFETEKPNNNVNDNVNNNVNDNVNVAIEGDSCADGFQQSDSCVDEIVKFYNENIGSISPHEYEVLNSYRDTFTDDIILFALKLQVEARATGMNYAKAILNNWQKKNVKTLLDAQNENKKRVTKEDKQVTNTYHGTQYGDLSKYYANL